ncbi:hypothetical protein [Wenzhouxiangella sp. EGI_FJ10409]|uniref:hypothetical protein n=1 Tax=Wenzhouxiangella sp. EGI_FJ10409 TaxID=3243767 RepID=UPI0035DF3031
MKSILLLLIILAFSMDAKACSCIEQTGPIDAQVERALERYDAVYIGYPMSIQQSTVDLGHYETQLQTVTWSVLESWKGPKAGRIPFVTVTNNTGGLCGRNIPRQERYLVVSVRTRDHQYSIPLCSISGPVRLSHEYIEELRH